MPSYNTISTSIPALYPQDSYLLFDAESTATITKSQQVVLANDNVGQGRQTCVIEGFFSGAPGVFVLLVQFADTDSENYYIAPTNGGTINAVTGANHFSFQYDAPGVLGRFIRANLSSCANSVNLTVKVTR